jgi:hypothetical protein
MEHFVKRRDITVQIVPQIREHLEKQKLQLGSKCPSSFGILKTSIALYILITTGAACIVEACLEKIIIGSW